MKKKLLLFAFLFLTVSLVAQKYGNEWINYSQFYFKMPVVKDGIYRIDSAVLANAGIPLSTIDARNLQVFGRGQEEYIFVKGEGDGKINQGDYIEFYARRNDGYLDTMLYNQNKVRIPNPYYSLVNDTAFYFITWNNSITNKRLKEETDVNFVGYTSASFVWKESLQYFSGEYFAGQTSPTGSTDPEYTKSEGWFDSPFTLGSTKAYSLNVPYPFISGPAARFQTAFIGASNDLGSSSGDHHVTLEFQDNASNWKLLRDTLFYGYKALFFADTISPSLLNNGTVAFRYTSVADPGFVSNRTTVPYLSIEYPQQLRFGGNTGYYFTTPDDGLAAKAFLDIADISNPTSGAVWVYDLTNHKRIPAVANGANYQVLIPNGGGDKACYLFSDAGINTVNSLKTAGINGQFTDYLSGQQDSSFLIVTHPALLSAAAQYGNYRSSMAGGSFPVILADVNQLYDQYAFGVPKHPQAIRGFAHQAYDNFPNGLAHLFLMGKSIHASVFRKDANNYKLCLVPSIGNPSADVSFTIGWVDKVLTPALSTGRLSASTTTHVLDYLDKVMQFESNSAEEWMKNVLHFGGGADISEQTTFKQYLANYEKVITDTSFGAKVYTFLKTTSAPIQLTISDSVKYLINNGASLLTFFGHASGSGFDQNLDKPTAYNNAGKYPLLMANSCLVGDIHQPPNQYQSETKASEDFVLAKQRGTIGFLASVALGVPYSLNSYTQAWYENMAVKNYGKSVGENIRETIRQIGNKGNNEFDFETKETCLNMTLHGDPAIVLNAHKLPDFAVKASSLFFGPGGKISTELDSFQVNVVVSNLGKAISNPVAIELKRYFPDNSVQTYNKVATSIYYKDTVVFTIAVDKAKGPGINKFEVRVDPTLQITELKENNNDLKGIDAVDLNILSGDIVPVYPYKYAIIPTDTVCLKASTSDPFATSANYIFELDTTDLFNSPFKRTQKVNSAGGVVVATMQQWITPISNLKDSTVYFWRVKRDTMDTVNFVWKESSFQYIKGKYGWEQAHFFQYKEDKFTYVKYNRITRSFDFVPTGKTLTCNTYGWVLSPFEWYRLWGTEFKLDLEQQDYAGCGGAAALHVAIIDPVSLEPWGTRWKDAQGTTFNPTHNFGNVNDFSTCRNRIDKRFIFQLGSKSQMDGMKNMLNNSVPAGHYVLIYTWNNFAPNSIDTGVLNSMRLLGCKKIDTVSKSRPFIFFAQKGVPASAQEVIGDSLKAAITLSTVLKNNADFGAITSTLIGPAQSWDSLSWRQFSLDNPITRDTARLDVTGIRPGYADSLIKVGLPIDSANIYLKSIDAKIFPQLKLKVNLKDDSLRTSPQMVKWQVFYTPVPEIAIDPKKHFSFVSDTLQEGESFKLKIAYSNVGEMPMDSMQMKYWVVDKHQVIHMLPATTTRPLAVNDTLIAQVSASSAGLDGLNNLWIEANPIGQVKTKPEQYHFNNMAYVPFYVGKDKMNPVLDVTFDGIHILNGDLVSAKPTIMVQVKDENKFLALNDTADFGLYITRPGSSLAEKIYFSSPEIQFTPAVLPANSCKINYAPALLVDGRYQLLVQAKDRSGNLSGSFDYKINFEIVNKSTITQVINYPNPFSTSTKFVFTLTGSEIPTYLKIQILTVSGKVVREITQDELGPIHIGRNITEYAWDGRDQFGDPLGNGLYLYRVVTKIQGNTIEHRETNADQFFDKEWGKMYLMR